MGDSMTRIGVSNGRGKNRLDVFEKEKIKGAGRGGGGSAEKVSGVEELRWSWSWRKDNDTLCVDRKQKQIDASKLSALKTICKDENIKSVDQWAWYEEVMQVVTVMEYREKQRKYIERKGGRKGLRIALHFKPTLTIVQIYQGYFMASGALFLRTYPLGLFSHCETHRQHRKCHAGIRRFGFQSTAVINIPWEDVILQGAGLPLLISDYVRFVA
jgi:hypothetical protein